MPTSSAVIYVDIDDTLVRSFGGKRIPMSPMIERVAALQRAGATLYCWSSGGADYAERSARELGLHDCFTAFLPKPRLLIDDVAIADWRLVELHPNECLSLTVDELLTRVP